MFAICPHVHPAASLIRNEPDQLVRAVDIYGAGRERGLAKGGGHQRTSVQRIWRAHGLQPYRPPVNLSNDPNLVDKLHTSTARACHLALGRREEPNPGARSHRTGSAREEGARRHHAHDYKRNGTTHYVCRLRCARRQGHWTLRSEASASGVHPLLNQIEAQAPVKKAVRVLDIYATISTQRPATGSIAIRVSPSSSRPPHPRGSMLSTDSCQALQTRPQRGLPIGPRTLV